MCKIKAVDPNKTYTFLRSVVF